MKTVAVSGPEFLYLLERHVKGNADDRHLLSQKEQKEVLSSRPDVSDIHIPTGPFDLVQAPWTPNQQLMVRDEVDLRGRVLPGALLMYGVVMGGMVDLRSATIQGDVDLTSCVFFGGLLLDDAEIEGSLLLPRVTARRISRVAASRVSMNGTVVRGQLDLRELQCDEDLRLLNASIAGVVDARGLSLGTRDEAKTLRMAGAQIRGDLRLGCKKWLDKSKNNTAALKCVDATTARIEGSVVIAGLGTAPDTDDLERSPHPTVIEVRWADAVRHSKQRLAPELVFTGAHIKGSFLVAPYIGQSAAEPWVVGETPSRQESPLVWPAAAGIKVNTAEIGGDFSIVGALVQGDIDASNVEVRGNVYLGSAGIDYPGRSALRQTAIGGKVNFNHSRIRGECFWQGLFVGGDVSCVSMQVEGRLAIASEVVAHHRNVAYWHGMGCEFSKGLRLPLCELGALLVDGAIVRGDVEVWGTRTKGQVRFGRYADASCRITGGINAHSLRSTQLELDGVDVGGQIVLAGVELLHLLIAPALLKLEQRLDGAARIGAEPAEPPVVKEAIVLPRCGSLVMSNGAIKGNARLRFVQVTDLESHGYSGLRISDSAIGGDVLFYDPPAIQRLFAEDGCTSAEAQARCPIDATAFGAAVMGNLLVNRSQVGAELNLRGVTADGFIDLEDCKFGGDLNVKRREAGNGHASHWLGASAYGLRLRMTQCDNDIDLTGLKVRGSGQGQPGKDRDEEGSISAQYLVAKADLKLYAGEDQAACVERRVDLSHAKLEHLRLAGCIFEADNGASDFPRLNLRHSRIGQLDVQQDPGASRGALAYPQSVSFDDSEVFVWKVDCGSGRGNGGAKCYVNLLRNDTSCQRSTYQALERYLRTGGDDDQANAVFYAMKLRRWNERNETEHIDEELASNLPSWPIRVTRRLATSRWNVLWLATRVTVDRLFRYVLGYGTAPLRLLAVVALLALVAFPVHLSRFNFEPSLQELTVPMDRAGSRVFVNDGFVKQPAGRPEAERPDAAPPVAASRKQAPSNREWSALDAIQMMLKTHLPMVPLRAREEWQPRGSGGTAWSAGSLDCTEPAAARARTQEWGFCVPFAPEDVVNFLQLLNWICWPILLTYLIRRLLRQ